MRSGFRPSAAFAALAVFGALLLVIACKEDTTLSAADYDKACSGDGDCVIVPLGDVCTCGEPGAIANKDKGRFESEYKDRRGKCSSTASCVVDPLNGKVGVCKSGLCAVANAPPGSDAGAKDAAAE
jgi:hypothetical protein